MPGAGGRGLARAAGRGKDQRAKAQAHGVPGQEGGEPRHTEDPKGSGHRLLDCAGLAGADARPGAEGQVRQGAGGSGSGFQLHMLPAVRGWFKRSLTKHVFKSGTWQLDMVTEMIRGSLGRPLGCVRCAGGCAGSCSHGRQVRPAQIGHPEEAGVGGWGVGQGRAACRAMPGQGSPAACACRWGLQGRTAQAGAGKGPKQAAYAVWIPSDPPWTADGKKIRNRQRRPDAAVWYTPRKDAQIPLVVARLQAGRSSRASLQANPQTPDSPFPLRRRRRGVTPTASLDAGTCRRPASMVFGPELAYMGAVWQSRRGSRPQIWLSPR